jgi:hypothetical protein
VWDIQFWRRTLRVQTWSLVATPGGLVKRKGNLNMARFYGDLNGSNADVQCDVTEDWGCLSLA